MIHFRRNLVTAGFALLAAFSAGALSAAAADIPVTVVFNSAVLPANAASVVRASGGTVISTIPEIGVVVASGPASMLDVLNNNLGVAAATPAIQAALPSGPSYVNNTKTVKKATADLYNAYQWDIKQVTNDGASYDLSTGTHRTVVGIVDTGVSTQHPALKANLLGGRNFTPDGPGGTVVPTDIEDRNGHGSHVAGAIAGNGRILGVGPDLGFKSYRVFGATGGAPTTRIVAGMIAAANDGVDVISMSLGGYDTMAIGYWTDPDTGITYRFKDVADFLAYRRAVQYALGKRIVVVAAAGNEGFNIANPALVTAYLNWAYGPDGYSFIGASREVPGTLAGVFTVSATGPDKSLASYSNYGPGAIDVTAPGGDNKRYPVGDWYTDMCLSAYMNGGYAWMDGTSMATPKVSAVAALIIDQAKAKGVRLTPGEAVTKVQQTAVDLGMPGYDPYFGQGMVNALSALTR